MAVSEVVKEAWRNGAHPPHPIPESRQGAEGLPAPMSGQNIVCFAKDWAEDPTSCNHVLEELAKTNKVLWLNSISTRSPSFSSGRDMGKIKKKIVEFLAGPREKKPNLWVFSPLVLPIHGSKLVEMLNRIILHFTITMLRGRLGMRDFQLWTFVPTSEPYINAMGAKLVVYYVTDNWSQFSSVDGERIGQMVNRQARKADIVFATAHLLVDQLKPHNSETHLASHGVKHALFAEALSRDTVVPADLASLPKPVLGYYGLIEDWMDQDLLVYLARRHPDWSIVLIGKAMVDTTRLAAEPNIHLLGRKPHGELPAYCKGFDVAIIPHIVNELTRHMNPIKLREYMSAGLPVVSTALPEVRHYLEHCVSAESYEEFDRAVEQAIASDSESARAARSHSMRGEVWEAKVRALGSLVMRALTHRGRRQ